MAHILVVDDDADIRDALLLVLETGGYEVRTAAHGREALDHLHDDPPALVLLDLMMPVMGGADFMERVRADARFDHLPVLLVTAWPNEAAAVRGVQGVLTKPVDVDQLFEEVGRLIARAEARRGDELLVH